MAFSTDFRQSHYEIYEIKLPFCSVCTPVTGSQKWHTPITCKEVGNGFYSLFFTKNSAPMLAQTPGQAIAGTSVLNGTIFRCVTGASEKRTELKIAGIASRGTMNLTLQDFAGDPGPVNFSEQGSFLGKLMARQVLTGKQVICHYYAIAGGPGAEKLQKVDETIYFITDARYDGKALKISAKDCLKAIEESTLVYPPVSQITIGADIDATQTRIEVSNTSGLRAGDTVRIGDELIRIKEIKEGVIISHDRGMTITSELTGSTVYKTDTGSHSAGDAVQLCHVLVDELLSDTFYKIMSQTDAAQYIDLAQWQQEIGEYARDARLIGVLSKPEAINKLLEKLCSIYMITMYFDHESKKIKLSVCSGWRESKRLLVEDSDLHNLAIDIDEDSRATRAVMVCKKDYQARADDAIEYASVTAATDLKKESADIYGSAKTKDFGLVPFASIGSAQTSTARYIQRFADTPKLLTFDMEERKIGNLKLADIVEVISRQSQGADGAILEARDRAQIMHISPAFSQIGRVYKVKASTYTPTLNVDGGEDIVIDLFGSIMDLNLFSRAGAPNFKANVTFLMHGCSVGSSAADVPAVRAGAFVPGSRIRIFCLSDTRWSAKGGDSSKITAQLAWPGSGGSSTAFTPATDGGISYQSDGVKTEIYLSGTYHDRKCAGKMMAAGGGGGCAVAFTYMMDRGGWSKAIHAYALFGGGNGIPAGGGGSVKTNEGMFFNVDIQTENGTFLNPGDSVLVSAGRIYPSDNVMEASAQIVAESIPSGAGGKGRAVSDVGGGSVNWDGVIAASRITTPGAGGAAIKGASVTVYCADNAAIKAGDSDPFTLTK